MTGATNHGGRVVLMMGGYDNRDCQRQRKDAGDNRGYERKREATIPPTRRFPWPSPLHLYVVPVFPPGLPFPSGSKLV